MQPIKTKAFSLLARRDHFTKELRRKLKERGYPSGEIELLLSELKQKGYLNDESLALRFVKRQREKGYGARVIAAKLRDKAGEVEVEIDESLEILQNLIERKYRDKDPKKAMASLMRRGYSYALIQKAYDLIREA